MEQYRKNNSKLSKILPIAVVLYMLAAFSWWAVLLSKSNHEIISLKKELYELDKMGQPEFQYHLLRYQNRQKMIMGEGLFFAISIITGIFFIYRGYLLEARSLKAQKNFLLSVTHELKSPLSAIRLILETFQKRPQLGPDKVRLLSQDALEETERLRYLIGNLLLSSQLEESWKPDYKKCSPSVISKKIIETYVNQYPEWQFNTDIILPESMEMSLDEQAYISIMRNLLDNAIKYAYNIKQIDIRLSPYSKGIRLEVGDHGTGIADDEKKKIFNKFYRLGEEETRKSKGTGLGLYIVAQLVHAHQGNIQVLNQEPNGAIFVVYLPNTD